MSQENPVRMSLVKARTITDLVPDDLSALQIAKFATVGPTVQLCAVGDIGFSGRVAVNLSSPVASDEVFAEIAPLFQKADITFGNLESPLSGDIAPNQLFSAPVAGAALLKKNGFKLINLANNHVYDYGRAGLVATLDAVAKADLVPLGVGDNFSAAQALVRTDMNGLRIGWLGCGRTLVSQGVSGPHYWEFTEHELLDATERNRADVDLLIVSIHIGLMYMDYPRPEHKAMAEKLMAAGADLILMHHAHVLQGVQVTPQRRVCCYNLGNFLFDWTEGNVKTPVMVQEQKESAVFLCVMDRDGVAELAALPIWIGEDCKVHWATGMRGINILNRLARISDELERNFVEAFKRQRAERNTTGIIKVIWFHILHGNWSFVLESVKKTRFEHVGMILRWLAGELKKRLVKRKIA